MLFLYCLDLFKLLSDEPDCFLSVRTKTDRIRADLVFLQLP